MSVAGKNAPLQGVSRSQKVGYIAESSFETIAGLSGIERFDVLDLAMKIEQGREPREDRRAYPGIAETICRKRTGTFGITAYLLPNGVAGSAPDIGSILEDIGFTEAIAAGVSVTYTPRDGTSSFALLNDTENLGQLAHGCLGTEMKLSWGGSSEAKLDISGKCSDIKRAGVTTLGVALAAAAATATLTESEYYDVGSYIQFDGDDNGGDGYKVISNDTATNVIGISPAAVLGAANGSTVSPVIPTGSTNGRPVCGNTGTITIDGVTAVTTAGSITKTFNVWTDDDNYGSESYTSNYRLVSTETKFSIDIYTTNPNMLQFIRTRDHVGTTSDALVVTIGDTAGSILTNTLSNAQYDIAELNTSGDVPMFQLAGTALDVAGSDWVLAFT